jgi:hypothetical protein
LRPPADPLSEQRHTGCERRRVAQVSSAGSRTKSSKRNRLCQATASVTRSRPRSDVRVMPSSFSVRA